MCREHRGCNMLWKKKGEIFWNQLVFNQPEELKNLEEPIKSQRVAPIILLLCLGHEWQHWSHKCDKLATLHVRLDYVREGRVCMCVCKCACPCALWKPAVTLGCCFSGAVCLVFEAVCFTWPWSSPTRLGGWPESSRHSPISPLPSPSPVPSPSVIETCHHIQVFTWMLDWTWVFLAHMANILLTVLSHMPTAGH